MADLNNVLSQYHQLMATLNEENSDVESQDGSTTANDYLSISNEHSSLDCATSTRIHSPTVFNFGTKLETIMTPDNGVTEMDVLRRNNISLLHALDEERKLRSKLERSLLLAQDEINVIKLEKDSEVETFRIACKRLQSQVRLLCEENGLDDVYQLFESDVQRLNNELHALRARNILLESRNLEGSAEALINDSHGSRLDIGPPPFTGYSNKESKRISQRMRQQANEIEALNKEVQRLRSCERNRAFSFKRAQNSTMRLRLATQASAKYRQCFEKEQAEHNYTKSSLIGAQEEANALELTCRRLKKEVEGYRVEGVELRDKLAAVESKFRQSSKMATFVAKHKGTGFRI